MGQILGLGITHYPPLCARRNMSWRLQQCLQDPALPERLRSVDNWHPTMRSQWANDQGQAHSDRHRSDLIEQFRRIRAELDSFNPDFVLIWGDDQYENFREDCVPAFSILAYEAVTIQPWKGYSRGRNAWDEPEDKSFTVQGHRAEASTSPPRCSGRASMSPTPTSRSTARSATLSPTPCCTWTTTARDSPIRWCPSP